MDWENGIEFGQMLTDNNGSSLGKACVVGNPNTDSYDTWLHAAAYLYSGICDDLSGNAGVFYQTMDFLDTQVSASLGG